MILRKIGVSHWRSLLDLIELGPFSERINVIHAPNGTGKSSLFEAMRRALFDAHHVTGVEIQAVRPWGRDLSPSVYVEFTEGDETYRVEKTFLTGASAKLLRREEGKFQPVADMRNADSRIREILAADAPGRGLSKQEHWGLAQILWAPQGELQLKNISESATERLRAVLGVQLSGESGGRLEELIAERFQQFFTPSGGGYRKGKNAAPIIALQDRREAVQAALIDLREKQQTFEEASRLVEDARHRRNQARSDAESLRETLSKTRTKAERYAKLQDQKKIKLEAADLAKQRFDNISETIERIASARKEIARLKEALHQANSRKTDLAEEVVAAKKRLEDARRERESARGKRSRLAEQQKTIEAARDYLLCGRELDNLSKRLGQIKEVEKNLEAARIKRDAIVAPDAKSITAVRKWLGKRDAAKAALSASQVHLTLTPEKTVAVHNLTDDSKASAAPGEPLTLSGDELIEVEVTGFGRVRASGPEGGAEEQRNAIAKAEAQIANLTQPYGLTDPDALQTLREKAEQTDREIANFASKANELLGEDDRDQLTRTRSELEARLAGYEKAYPAWKSEPPVVAELQEAYENLNKEISTAIEKAEDAFDTRQSEHTAAENQVGELAAQIKADQRSLESEQARLSELMESEQTDDDRKQAKSNALMAWQAAKDQAENADSELKEFPGDPAKELKTLENQHTALETSEAMARDEEKTAEGRLQALAAEGTYSKLVLCEEELFDLDERIGRESVRMQAIRLLHDTMAECKSAVIASVAAPIERKASRMLSRVVGPRLGDLRLAQDFVPEAVAPELASDPVHLANLSGGEQEQLFLIARLALADVLAQEQRQLVVLDDVLNATDAGRHARLLNLLEEVSERLQVIILTCHPERYRALEPAEFFELKVAR